MSQRRRKRPDQPKPPRIRSVPTGTSTASIWERMPPLVRHAVAISFLLLVVLGFYAPVTFGGFGLVGGDTVQWRGMAESMIAHEAETGQQALWAPNGFAGMPGYLIHYPKVVAQLDSVVAWMRNAGWWPGAHFFALLLGMYGLVFYLTREALASALGAVAFGLTTYIPIILAAGHNTKFVALAFAPWLALTFVYALRRPPGASWLRTLLGGLLFALALAVNLRAEHVQITYYLVIALGIVWIAEGVGAWRSGEGKQFAFSTAALALGGGLAVLMVAHPYLIQAEYKAFTIRSAGEGGGLAWDYAMSWSQGWGELATLLVPGAYGSDGGTYWGAKPFTAGPHYFGPVVLMLAGLALGVVRRRLVTGFAVAAGVMVLFSLGENLVLLNRPMFLFFPLFDAFRVPETWLSLVALCVAVLAGVGAYALSRVEASAEAETRKTRAVYGSVGAMLGLVVLIGLGGALFFPFEAPGEQARIVEAVAQQSGVSANDPRVVQAASGYLAEVRGERRAMLFGDAVRAFVFVVIGGGVLILARRRHIPAWAAQVALLLLVTVDLWQVDRRYFNADHPAIRSSSEITRAIPEYDVDRFIRTREAVAGGPGHFRTLPLALNPFNDGRSPFFYESIGGYHGAKLTIYQEYIDELLVAPGGGINPTALDLTATRFIIHSEPVGGMTTAFQGEQTGLVVLERPDYAPRAFFPEFVETVPDRAAMFDRLRNPEHDITQTSFVYEPVEGVAGGPVADTLAATATLVRFTPREIVWEIATDRPRLFVASEVYYPAGWTAQIRQEEVPIVQVNHIQRGVVVPEGEYLLSMRFDPPTHRLSVAISTWATLLIYLATLFVAGVYWYRSGRDA